MPRYLFKKAGRLNCVHLITDLILIQSTVAEKAILCIILSYLHKYKVQSVIIVPPVGYHSLAHSDRASFSFELDFNRESIGSSYKISLSPFASLLINYGSLYYLNRGVISDAPPLPLPLNFGYSSTYETSLWRR